MKKDLGLEWSDFIWEFKLVVLKIIDSL
jgi:hypothetical protein